MAARVQKQEPNLPWLDNREDRTFRRLTVVMLLLFIGAGLVLNAITLPEMERKTLVDVSPRLAKLILEKQKVKPPPKPEAPPPEKKEVEKKEEPPKAEKKEVKKESAREVAKKSGLIALQDELEDLREAFALDDVLEMPQQTGGSQEVKVATSSDLLTSGAQQSSGGIQSDTLNRKLTTSELSQRQTTQVQSKIDTSSKTQVATASTTQKSASGSGGRRGTDEITRVFEKNKGAIFSLYNRALRKNPLLEGKVVVELTIAPSGEVTRVDILSSELGDEDLERKLALRIKRFKFSSANVAEITVTYPIDFLPS